MVKLLNIVWGGDTVKATLMEEGYIEPSYNIVYDLKNRKLIENGSDDDSCYVWQAIYRLEKLYEEGKRPKECEAWWY